MTRVQADWLTLVLVPVALVSLGLAFVAARQKARQNAGDEAVGGQAADGRRLPAWGMVAQTVGIVLVVIVALVQMTWGS